MKSKILIVNLSNFFRRAALFAVITGFSFWSCDNDPKDVKIELKAPDNNAYIDLAEVESISFGWDVPAGVSDFTIKFAISQAALANDAIERDAGNNGSYVMSSADFDQLLANNTLVQPGQVYSEIFWTVTGVAENANVVTEVRKFTVKRLPALLYIELKAPDNNTNIDLATVESISFEWNRPAGLSNYIIKFAASQAALDNDAIERNAGNNGSYVMNSADFDRLLAENALVQPGHVYSEIFWTVTGVAENANIVTEVRKITVRRRPALLFVSVSALFIPAEPTAAYVRTLNVVAINPWAVQVTQTGAWLTVQPTGGTETGTLTVTAQANTTGATRYATINIFDTRGELSRIINVTQWQCEMLLTDQEIAEMGICIDDAHRKLSHEPTGEIYVENVKIDFSLSSDNPDYFDFTGYFDTWGNMEIYICGAIRQERMNGFWFLIGDGHPVYEGTLNNVPNLGILVNMYKKYCLRFQTPYNISPTVSIEMDGRNVLPKLYYALAQECIQDNTCSQTRRAVLQMVLDRGLANMDGTSASFIISARKAAIFLMSVIMIKENYADFIEAVHDNPDLQRAINLSVYRVGSAFWIGDLGKLVSQFAENFINEK